MDITPQTAFFLSEAPIVLRKILKNNTLCLDNINVQSEVSTRALKVRRAKENEPSRFGWPPYYPPIAPGSSRR